MKARILVVEDERDIRELVCYTLGKEGWDAVGAASGEEGLAALEGAGNPPSPGFDLVLLDLMLPGIDGIETLRRLRKGKAGGAASRVPVIILSAKGEEGDIVKGLECGADDYMSKPFSPRVLVARVRTRLRENLALSGAAMPGQAALIGGQKAGAAGQSGAGERETGEVAANPRVRVPEEPIAASGLSLDVARHELRSPRGLIDLSATEFSLMEFFMSNPGWVFSRSQIIDAVRGPDYPVTDRAVDVQILGLRKKLGEYGELVETVRGVGYRLRDGRP